MTLRFSPVVLAGVLALGAPGLASAQTTTAPVPVPPKPDFSTMQYLVGTWTCSTKSARRPAAQASTSTWAMDPTGYWLIGHTAAKAVPWYPHDSVNVDMLTYDATTKRWVDINTDDTGEYDITTSPGWSGSTLTWTELTYTKGNDTATEADTVMTKNSDTKTTAVSSFKTTAGANVGVTTTCTKT